MFVGALFARAFLFLYVCCFRSLSPPLPDRGGAAALCAARRIRQRGAFACKSLSSFFFSPPNSYLSSGGRREIEVFFLLLLLLTYNATVEVSSSKMVKRESTQVENESGKAYHLISKVYPMTFVCRLQRRRRRRRRRRRHRHASPDYKSKGATNFFYIAWISCIVWSKPWLCGRGATGSPFAIARNMPIFNHFFPNNAIFWCRDDILRCHCRRHCCRHRHCRCRNRTEITMAAAPSKWLTDISLTTTLQT